MLVKVTKTHTFIAPIIRAAVQLYPEVVRYALPTWVDPNDYIELKGGGWASKPTPSVAKATNANNEVSLGYTKDNPLVRVESSSWYEGRIYAKNSMGDGVTPFGFPLNTDYHSVAVNDSVELAGNWKYIHHLTYQNGFTETVEYERVVTGDPSDNFADEELYVAGLPIPEYSEDWQVIADFWDGRDPLRHAAAQARADLAEPKPTAESHPSLFPLDQLGNDAPAELLEAKEVVSTGQTVGDDAINIYESLAKTNRIQAALNELNFYADRVKKWHDLSESASNPNLKKVAEANATYTSIFLDQARAAHSGYISFDIPDGAWQMMSEYNVWFLKQPIDQVVDVKTWDEVLGRPN